MLGPINLMKLKLSLVDYGRRLVAELWMYPNGSRILELSTKCTPAGGFQVAAERQQRSRPRRVSICPASNTPGPRRHSSTSPRT
jgi:hypothetical protein